MPGTLKQAFRVFSYKNELFFNFFFDFDIEFTLRWCYYKDELKLKKGFNMTIKCEKCGADVELLEGAKSAKCEKCGAEVTVKEEAAAEATEEKKTEEKKEEAKSKKIAKLVVEIIVICAALAMVPRIAARLHQLRMNAAGMPLTEDNCKQLFEYNNAEAESVVLPGCLSSIGESAFEKCTKLKSVTIPATVKEIGNGAFRGVTTLEEVKIGGGAGVYALLNVATLSAFKKDATPIVIGNSAFEECRSLKSIEFPAGVTAIGQGAFADCKALTEVTIPATVTKIDSQAFIRSGLKKITIPDSVQEIGRMAFSYTNLEEISVPKQFTDEQIAKWGVNMEKCKVVKR